MRRRTKTPRPRPPYDRIAREARDRDDLETAQALAAADTLVTAATVDALASPLRRPIAVEPGESSFTRGRVGDLWIA